MLKGIFVIIDGLGDLPCKLLENKTPLESAQIPNMNFLAARGELGYMYPVKPGFIPGSGEALASIFGNSPNSISRGQLEAKGIGLKLKRGDLALRVNFATIDSLEKGNILDRRAGRTLTDDEVDALAKALNKINMPVKFEFVPSVHHKAVLVFRGGFSDNVSCNDTNYSEGKFVEISKIQKCISLDEDENTVYTANILNEFIEKAHHVLKEHPINLKRIAKGFPPANVILIRGGGAESPRIKQYPSWVSVNYAPLSKGFAEFSGMKVFSFDYPKFKGIDAYANLYDGLKMACDFSIKTIKKISSGTDYFYIHLRETDYASHDNKPIEKKNMLEFIDKTLFKFLREFAPLNKVKVVVTGDHSTPCNVKNHTAEPVPVLFFNGSIPREKKFSEKDCRITGTLGRMNGNELFAKTFFRGG